MRIDQLIGVSISHLMRRVVRRALAAVALAVFAVVALYHFTVAGLISLDGQFGTLDARLIVGGIYGALALIALGAFWVLGRSPDNTRAPALTAGNQRELQLAAMLIEAVMLGYALARKRERAN